MEKSENGWAEGPMRVHLIANICLCAFLCEEST